MPEPVDPRELKRLDDGGSGVREATRTALIRNISKRLRPVCSQMPSAEFDAMVREMADIELKYSDLTTPPYPAGRAD